MKKCKIGDTAMIIGGNPEYVGMTCDVVDEPTHGTHILCGCPVNNCDPSRDWVVHRNGAYGLWYDCHLMPLCPDSTDELGWHNGMPIDDFIKIMTSRLRQYDQVLDASSAPDSHLVKDLPQ